MPVEADRPIEGVRFGHVNVIARDWRSLASWYERLFGCIRVPPERDYSGPDLDRGTGLAGAILRGVHLRLPGLGDNGPTLEIYSYASVREASERAIDRPGWGHICFAVADVKAARQRVLDEGGEAVGEVVTLQAADGRRVTWCYVADPEGNIVELQSWAPAE